MPHILWSRSTDGQQPGLVVGHDRILLHYTTSYGKNKGVRLLCYDMEGRVRWSRLGWRGMLRLPGNRFLVNATDDSPLVVAGEGDICHRWKHGKVERAEQHGDTLLLDDGQGVRAADLELRPLWQVTWPASRPAIYCFARGAFYWAEGNSLWRCTPQGRAEVFCRLPQELITGAMDEWEQTTGNSALAGGHFTPGMPDFTLSRRGDRPFSYYWRVSFDAAREQFFLADVLAPHLLLCFNQAGRPRWCRYISFGCCGGTPCRLPNGLYVASSGCGGILSWLDGDGHILFQSLPHGGVGLATAYSNEVWVLPDGRCLVQGGPGVVAYDATGERLWVFPREYSSFYCDPARQILVGCYWQNKEPDGSIQTHLEFAHGL